MSAITTHVLDTSRGLPASGMRVVLEWQDRRECWHVLQHRTTNADGRAHELWPLGRQLDPGLYRLTFDTGSYFQAHGVRAFFPHVMVVFEVEDTSRHYHVPLLLSPYGYSTYRGS